jgi:hypothetical protein
VQNSRVRDFLDMVLLIQSGTLDVSTTAEAIVRTFNRRGTHPISPTLEPPPPDWNTPFVRLAEECHLDHSVSEAFAEHHKIHSDGCQFELWKAVTLRSLRTLSLSFDRLASRLRSLLAI